LKRYLFLLIFHSSVSAQSVIPLSGFQNVLSLYNPAAAGINDGIEFSLLHKAQWTGFPQAPKLYAVSINTPFNYQRFGAGFNLYNETSGPQNFLSLNGNFCYKINLGKGRLSYGTKLGMVQWNEDFSNLIVKDPDETTSGNKKIGLDIGSGLLYKDKKYCFGFSLNYSPGIYLGNKFINRIYYNLSAGVKQKIGTTIDLHSAVLIRYTNNFPPLISISFPIEYKKFLWTGISYRSYSVLSIMVGFNLNQLQRKNGDKITVFYYYDYSGSKKNLKPGNSHEIILCFSPTINKSLESIKRKRATISPLYFD
jgi:type IX secretion system PorP/SprF family membrane protein